MPGLTLVTFCGPCTIIFCRSGASCHRTVIAFRLEGNRSPDGTETIEAMGEAFGTKPEDLCVCIGPSICRDCCEVSEDGHLMKEELEQKSVRMIQHPVIPEWEIDSHE